MAEMTYPYSDKYMRYDKATHRYVLTMDYLTEVLSIDIERRTGGTVQSQNTINNLLNRISSLIYGYVYKYNDRQVLTWLIAKAPSARQIIMDAMGQQAAYVLTVGDLTLSPREEERNAWLDVTAKNTLEYVQLVETGKALCNVLPYRYAVPSYEEGDY